MGIEEGKATGSGLFYVVSRGVYFNKVSTVFDTNFDVNFGRATHEARIAKWNMGSCSVFGLRPKEITEHFDRLGVKKDKAGMGDKYFPALKAPRQCPPLLLEEFYFREGKAL